MTNKYHGQVIGLFSDVMDCKEIYYLLETHFHFGTHGIGIPFGRVNSGYITVCVQYSILYKDVQAIRLPEADFDIRLPDTESDIRLPDTEFDIRSHT